MEDTDTLLALLSSLLSDPLPSQDALLDALVRADGDVKSAAKALGTATATRTQDTSRKRKRPAGMAGLDNWLKRPSLTPRARSLSPTKTANSTTSSLKPLSLGPTPSTSSGSSKPVVNLMDVLRAPESIKQSVPRPPPLTLANASMVALYTPCTLHQSILPPELACNLFYTMLDEARHWSRNKWWLFDRLVESPHRSAFYTRSAHGKDGDDEAWRKITKAWYNGRDMDPPGVFPSAMEEACKIIETVVNAEIRKRQRYPLEWGGDPSATEPGAKNVFWRANFAASNCYDGAKETVGFHSDRLTSLGPYPTIASLSLGTPRTFRLREVIPIDQIDKRAAQTYNIPLPHNSLLIMHASMQERFKHSIPPQSALDRFRPAFPPHPSLPALSFDPATCRINITFRFYRPDFHPDTIPRCKCGEMTTLRPDMKQRQKERTEQSIGKGKGRDADEPRPEGEFRYWWTCTAGDQNEGKGCGFWKVMDVRAEGRGPFAVVTDPNNS